jgi:hypothetical protein
MLLKRIGDVPDKWVYTYAHIVMEERGLARQTAIQNLKFVWGLIGLTVASFFRWKRYLPLRAIRTMTAWAAGSLKNLLHKHK